MFSHGVSPGASSSWSAHLRADATPADRGHGRPEREAAALRRPLRPIHLREPRPARSVSGFVGEFLILLGAFRYDGVVAGVTTVVVILSAVYMLWMFQRVFFTVPSDWMRRSGADCAT